MQQRLRSAGGEPDFRRDGRRGAHCCGRGGSTWPGASRSWWHPTGISAAETELIAAGRGPLDRLTRRVQQWAGRHHEVHLLGLDRFGLRYRVEGRGGCYGLRVPFASPLPGPAAFAGAVGHLVACGPT
jgi:hypothetical protein